MFTFLQIHYFSKFRYRRTKLINSTKIVLSKTVTLGRLTVPSLEVSLLFPSFPSSESKTSPHLWFQYFWIPPFFILQWRFHLLPCSIWLSLCKLACLLPLWSWRGSSHFPKRSSFSFRTFTGSKIPLLGMMGDLFELTSWYSWYLLIFAFSQCVFRIHVKARTQDTLELVWPWNYGQTLILHRLPCIHFSALSVNLYFCPMMGFDNGINRFGLKFR